ncbi:hypothetical protein ACFQH0_12980 [Frigoriflavimonas asaccharolytica]
MILFCTFAQAQKKEFWLIDTQTQKIKIVKDSTSAVKFLDSLAQSNYFFAQVIHVKKEGNLTKIQFDKGKNYNQTYVQITDNDRQELNLDSEIYTKNLDSLKKTINKKFIAKGFAFSRVQSKYLGTKNGIPIVELTFNKNDKRTINGFVFKGYENLPSRFVKNLNKEFQGKIYDDKNLLSINNQLQNHPFLALDRPPQSLFTKDSTQIYLFTQKKKTNSFDGIIGFGNDKTEKFTFNGTINVNFRNVFNGFETINLYWQKNPDQGQTFNLQTDIQYFLKSNIGLNVNVNIFRQDSTFANVKLLPSVYYNLSSRQKVGLRGTFETSVILDSLYTQGRDYTKTGAGTWYQFREASDVELFQNKTNIRAEADFLTINYADEESKGQQMRYFLSAERNVHISGNHYLNLKGESALMSSKNEFSNNELIRFGGWNSLRGFNEESLYADFYYYGSAEYRYLVGEQAFFDTFLQYGKLNNKNLGVNPELYSVGIGFNFFLPIGLMSFQIANGNQFRNEFRFGDTKIHWGLLSRF